MSASRFALTLLLLSAVAFTHASSAMAADESAATVVALRGKAQIERGKKTLDAKLRDGVLLIDTVLTREASRAKLIFIDDSILTLGESSRVVVKEYVYRKGEEGSSIFNLLDGKMKAVVGANKFEVHTPTAVAAARGTVILFDVGMRNGKPFTDIFCLRGVVDVTPAFGWGTPSVGKTVTLKPGETVTVGPEGPIPPPTVAPKSAVGRLESATDVLIDEATALSPPVAGTTSLPLPLLVPPLPPPVIGILPVPLPPLPLGTKKEAEPKPLPPPIVSSDNVVADNVQKSSTPSPPVPIDNVQQPPPPLSKTSTTFIDPFTGMEFVFVKGGCFMMGDVFGGGYWNEKPVHEVCVDDFWIGKYEVTQAEWQKVTETNPSYFKGPRNPVEQISRTNVAPFLREAGKKAGKPYRLPTEAEWEYAARSGGRKEKYAGGDVPGNVAWLRNNSGKKTHPVGGKAPNGLGIYDMSGNVLEWCSDWYHDREYWTLPSSGNLNPQGPKSGTEGVLRGGSWWHPAEDVRTSNRIEYNPGIKRGVIGIRVVFSAGSGKKDR